MDSKELVRETQNDKVLSKVKKFVLNGLPSKNKDNKLCAYFVRKDQINHIKKV